MPSNKEVLITEFDVEHEEQIWSKIFDKEIKKKTFVRFSSYWWEMYYNEIIEYITPIVEKFNNAYILEAGAGSGKSSILIGNKVKEITLLDISKNALNYAQYLSKMFNVENINFINGNIFFMPFDKNKFDFTWNIGVLEHYSKEKFKYILKEMCRVTKNNGYVAFGVPNFYSGPILKAFILSTRLFNWIPGYKLDTEKFYSVSQLKSIVSSLVDNDIIINDLNIEYFGSLLPMETPKSILKITSFLNSIFRKNKFLIVVSFKINKKICE